MRQLAALIAAFALLPTIAQGQASDVPTFAGIPWGAPAPDVVKAVTLAGFEVVEKDSDGDYQFAGTLFGAVRPQHMRARSHSYWLRTIGAATLGCLVLPAACQRDYRFDTRARYEAPTGR